jgi:tetratricopeptide (TPR) repeat protein
VQAATAATLTCQEGDPYIDSEKVVDACSALLATSTVSADERLIALRQRAEAFYWANRDELALADLDAAIDLNQKSVATLRRRGWTNLALNRLDAAYADFTEALNLDPENADTLFALGFILSDGRGSAGAARVAYEQALTIDPEHHLARANLARLYFYFLEDADKALEHIDRIVSSDPKEVGKVRYKTFPGPQKVYDYYAFVRLQRAEMRLQLKRFGPALEDANWVIEKYPNVASALAIRADIRRYERDDANALADAERALAIEPSNEAGQIVKLYSLSRLGREEELAEFATSVIDGKATDNARGNAFFFRGEALKHKNERQAAIADMERSFELAPFFLVATLHRLKDRGYYEGDPNDAYTKAARVGLEACMIDPEC